MFMYVDVVLIDDVFFDGALWPQITKCFGALVRFMFGMLIVA